MLPLTDSIYKLKEITLKAAHTPDPDDAYAWWAIRQEKIKLSKNKIDVETNPIQVINENCITGFYDIAAISSAAYPYLFKDYAILSTGASVGRGYGPVLASLTITKVSDLNGKRIAIPGKLTTGALLLNLLLDSQINVESIEMPCNRIARAILEGEVDAGILIHEELLNWEPKGLKKLLCLGHEWQTYTGLPIPVGLHVVKRSLRAPTRQEIATLIVRSMEMAEDNHIEATEWALNFSGQVKAGIGKKFIGMFANEDTLCLKDDCIIALKNLYFMAHRLALIPTIPPIDIIHP